MNRWCFNSATALKPWMSGGRGVKSASCIRLHFGHGVEAVDDIRKGFESGFMTRLQFGHGVEAVDDPRSFFPPFEAGDASIRPRR